MRATPTLTALGLEHRSRRAGRPAVAAARRGGQPRWLLGVVRVARRPVVTNHHCVQGALAATTRRPRSNLVENGFLAKTRADEKLGRPDASACASRRRSRDVTARCATGSTAIEDPVKRKDEIEKREKQLIAACEKDRPGMRCKVAQLLPRRRVPADRVPRDPRRAPRLRAAPRRSATTAARSTTGRGRATPATSRSTAPTSARTASPPTTRPTTCRSSRSTGSRCSRGVVSRRPVFVTGYPGLDPAASRPLAETRRAIEWDYPRSSRARRRR